MNETDVLCFILNDRMEPIVVDANTYVEWRKTYDNSILREDTDNGIVSTVFMGIPDGRGRLFETKVFGGCFDGFTWHHGTFHHAMKGHRHAVELIKVRHIWWSRLLVFWMFMLVLTICSIFGYLF